MLGETRGLLPASAPLYGEDEESCLLSEDMAYKLFGSKDVMGEEILYRGRILTVRGILRGMEGTAAVQAVREGDSVLDTIAYEANTEVQSSENPVQAFLLRHAIQGKVLERKYFSACAKLLIFCLPMVIFSQNGRADHRNYEGAEGQTDTDSSLVGSDDTDDSPIFHAFLEISRPDQGCGANKMVRLYILETHDAADTG